MVIQWGLTIKPDDSMGFNELYNDISWRPYRVL